MNDHIPSGLGAVDRVDSGAGADSDSVHSTGAVQSEVVSVSEAEALVRSLLWDEHPECCGSPVVGAEYMGQQGMICCGCPEGAMLNDAQIVATLRAKFPAAATGGKTA